MNRPYPPAQHPSYSAFDRYDEQDALRRPRGYGPPSRWSPEPGRLHREAHAEWDRHDHYERDARQHGGSLPSDDSAAYWNNYYGERPDYSDPAGHRQFGEFESGIDGRFGEGEQGYRGQQGYRSNSRSGGHYAYGPSDSGRPAYEERGPRWRGEGRVSREGRPLPGASSAAPGSRYDSRYGGEGFGGHDPWDSFGNDLFSGADLARRERSGPKGYTRSDERIRDDVCERLYRNHRLEVSDVSVDVREGRVTLDGSVPDRRMKHDIEDLVEHCIGVADIDNKLRVSRAIGSGPQGEAREGQPANRGASRGSGPAPARMSSVK